MDYADEATACLMDGYPLFSVPPPLSPEAQQSARNRDWKLRRGKRKKGWVWLLGSCTSGSFSYGLIQGFERRPLDDRLFAWDAAQPWFVQGVVFAVLFAVAKRAELRDNQEHENELARDESMPFVLLLRPFKSEASLTVKQSERSTEYWDRSLPLARIFSDALRPDLQLRIIGGSIVGPGIVRTSPTDDVKWRRKFHRLVHQAKGILVFPLPGRVVPWEIGELRRKGLLGKTLFIIPDADLAVKSLIEANAAGESNGQPSQSEASSILQAFRNVLRAPGKAAAELEAFHQLLRSDGFQVPSPQQKPCIVALDPSGKMLRAESLHAIDDQAVRKALERHWEALFH